MSPTSIAPGLHISKQPTSEDLLDLAARGFRTVINLRCLGEDHQPIDPLQEGRLCEARGLTYHHIAVTPQKVSENDMDKVRDAVAGAPRPVLVHCSTGKRAGAFALMQVACQKGHLGDEVLQQAAEKNLTLDSKDLRGVVITYVDSHQPTAR